MRNTLDALRAKHITTVHFCASWREQAQQSRLLATLPPRYAQVMEDLLCRLESNSAFSEESCSFSQEDLLIALADWLDKAESKLQATTK